MDSKMGLYEEFQNTIYGWAKLNDADLKVCIEKAEKMASELIGTKAHYASTMLSAMKDACGERVIREVKNSQINENEMITDKEIDNTIGKYENVRELIDLLRTLQEERKWKSIASAPIGKNAKEQILCRFWYDGIDPHWVYMICFPNGANTQASGYTKPEEWLPLSLTKD